MKFDNIIANAPFGKIGVEIVNKITKEVPYNDISILGTSAMLSKHNDVLALEYVYIKEYWDDMSYEERFWWLVDKGFYKKYVVQSDNK